MEANDEFFELVGYTREDIRDLFNNKGFNTLHEDDKSLAALSLMEQVKTNHNGKFGVTCRVVNKNSGYTTIHYSGCIIKDENGKSFFYFLLSDITNYANSLKQLEKEKEYNKAMSELEDSMYFDWDIPTKTMTFSSNFANKMGIPELWNNYPESMINSNIIAEDSFNIFEDFYSNPSSDEKGKNVHLITIDKSDLWCSAKYKAVKNESGVVVRIIGKMIDITNHLFEIKQLEKEASTDKLTGINNRLGIEKELNNLVNNLDKDSIQSAFIILDVDNFKKANDTFGHTFGDAVLKDISEILLSTFRGSDLIGRLGGDEFVVVMNNYKSLENIKLKATEICNKANQVYKRGDEKIAISLSLGISLWPNHGESFEMIYKYADSALYHVKNNGRNNYCIYDKSKMHIDLL